MAGAVDEALLKDFVLDSHEHLNAVEPDLLAMESGGCVSPRPSTASYGRCTVSRDSPPSWVLIL